VFLGVHRRRIHGRLWRVLTRNMHLGGVESAASICRQDEHDLYDIIVPSGHERYAAIVTRWMVAWTGRARERMLVALACAPTECERTARTSYENARFASRRHWLASILSPLKLLKINTLWTLICLEFLFFFFFAWTECGCIVTADLRALPNGRLVRRPASWT
jgi:hypothetical protein